MEFYSAALAIAGVLIGAFGAAGFEVCGETLEKRGPHSKALRTYRKSAALILIAAFIIAFLSGFVAGRS